MEFISGWLGAFMNEHYFSEEQTSKVIVTPISISFFGKDVRLDCVSGTFSKVGIDFATSLLLHHAKIKDGWKVLDLGCGIGVIGICIKKTYPNCDVVLSDVNQRALTFSVKNATKNKVKVEVVKSDLFAVFSARKFDTIISNPPHHAGRAVVFQLIEDSIDHLVNGGCLQLVARHAKGGKMIVKKMEEVFGNCETLVKKGGVRVYCSEKE
jgi:16S rRNA (guanine1207-N2)-methyltransferase